MAAAVVCLPDSEAFAALSIKVGTWNIGTVGSPVPHPSSDNFPAKCVQTLPVASGWWDD